MPELPDVEIFGNYFDKHALNKKIQGIAVFNPKILKSTTEVELQKALKGKKFLGHYRHGKHLFIAVSNGLYLGIHFGMTGFFHFFTHVNEYSSHTRYQVLFEKGICAYVDPRMLGGLSLVHSVEEIIKQRRLGPDALSISIQQFKKIFQKKGKLKSTLMDQSHVAGLGNIYTDEVLFQAHLHPLRENHTLSEEMVISLYKTMKQVLKKAIEGEAEAKNMPPKWLIPVRKTHQQCPLCLNEIKRISLRGRGTYFCSHCQS